MALEVNSIIKGLEIVRDFVNRDHITKTLETAIKVIQGTETAEQNLIDDLRAVQNWEPRDSFVQHVENAIALIMGQPLPVTPSPTPDTTPLLNTQPVSPVSDSTPTVVETPVETTPTPKGKGKS